MKRVHLGICAALVTVLAALLADLAVGQSKTAAPIGRNMNAGTLTVLDEAAGTVTIQPQAGEPVSYRVTDKTQVLKDRRPVELGDLALGVKVVVRYRKSKVGPPTLYDLLDQPSWDWISKVRKETQQAKVREIADNELKVEIGVDQIPFTYRITEKTNYLRQGATAQPDAFKPGETVWIVPRLLSSGILMATSVSDSSESAAKLKERAKRAVSATVRSVDTTARTVTFVSDIKDERTLPLAEPCLVTRDGKEVALSAVKSGAYVTAHLRRKDDGEQEVTRLTIKVKRVQPYKQGAATVPRLPAKKPAATTRP